MAYTLSSCRMSLLTSLQVVLPDKAEFLQDKLTVAAADRGTGSIQI